MRNNREKTITIVAIIASVLVLSVGFAAFTGSLKFSLSASVSSDSSAFKVQFSSGTTTSSVKTSETIAASNKTTGLTAGNATLDNSAAMPSMSNSAVVLTKPGDFAEYSFYAVNTGEFDAYLDSITYTLNSGNFVTCTAATGTDATLVSSACSAIKVKVTVGDVITETTKTGIISHKLSKGSYEQVKVRIYYDENGSRADGNFSVSIGDITLAYISVGGATIYSVPDGKVCTLISGTKGSVGSKYLCQVNSSDTFNFYLLSTNTDGSYNLIMERNICENGTVATSTNTCYTEWYSPYADNEFGPVTAMTYLNNATDEWSNVSNINMDYTDEVGGYTIKTTSSTTTITSAATIATSAYSGSGSVVTATFTNLKSRLPYRQELINSGCTSGSCTWLVGYLAPSSSVTGTTTIEEINGYWTASAYLDEYEYRNMYFSSWFMSNNGSFQYKYVQSRYEGELSYIGVRPVIQVNVSDVE